MNLLVTVVFIILVFCIGVIGKTGKIPGSGHPFKKIFGNKNDR